mmetsp:Transcript_14444/g.22416  ORF Transcript_14444/g.22416 Transcript_14444/m.22416 type:complete len:117 (-) Transcript_14444:124-474(-)
MAKVHLIGRVQRQTITPLNQFYTCIQYVGVNGVPLRSLAGFPSSNPSEADSQSSSSLWELKECKQCNWCGAFPDAPPGFNCGKLNKCGQCKKVWYCKQEHQKRDWKAGHKEQCKKA